MQSQNKVQSIQCEDIYDTLCTNGEYLAFCGFQEDMISTAVSGLKVAKYGVMRGEKILHVSQNERGPIDIVTPSYENNRSLKTGQEVAKEMFGLEPEYLNILSESSFRMKNKGRDRLENRLKSMAILKKQPRERYYFDERLYIPK